MSWVNLLGLNITIMIIGVSALIIFNIFSDRLIMELNRIGGFLANISSRSTEIVQLMDKESDVQISDHAVTKLKEFSARPPSPLVLPEDQTAYEAGLKDGVTELSKFVLEEMKETKSA